MRTTIYGSYVISDVIVLENTNVVHFSCDMGKYSTCPMNKVFAWRLTPYSLDECCIFPYRTQMTTVCISYYTPQYLCCWNGIYTVRRQLHTKSNTTKIDRIVCKWCWKRHNQAKYHKKSSFLFWLLDILIWGCCGNVASLPKYLSISYFRHACLKLNLVLILSFNW